MRAICPALMVCLLVGAAAQAQVPRDPFTDRDRTEPATGATPTAQGNALPAPYVTRQRDMEIPFSVRAGTTPETQPAAVRVFVSWEQGRAWHLYDERRPEDGRFRFRPKQDGEYWFATQTIDRSGRPDSPEPRRPQLRLIVDTQRPQLQVHTQVHGSGEIAISWTAVDPTLNPTTLKFEYQDATTSGPWEAVTVTTKSDPTAGQSQGQSSFRPAVPGKAINLRAEVADAAGNVAYFNQRLSLAPSGLDANGALAYAPPADPSATRWPSEADGTSSPQNNQWIAGKDVPSATGGTSKRGQMPNMIDNPFAGTGRLASAPQTNQPVTEDFLPAPANEPVPRSGGSQDLPVAGQDQFDNPPAARDLPDQYEGVPAQTDNPSGPAISAGDVPAKPDFSPGPEEMPAPHAAGATADEEPVEAPLGQRPRLTNSRRFSLDYDVEAVGPEGVAAVELWGTGDGGQTWAKWGVDPDRTSPFDVEVNNESTYGFRIVIVGKSGLATSAPQSGDAADIWVGIDATRPVARLTNASYGQGEAAGKLEIRWEASDANLGPRPITLAISDRPDGQFTPIAAGLPNTGQYDWEFDPRSPRQIYLRLEVRDEAGNIAIDQLTEPIKVEGLEPKGRIRGFNPAPESSREAFRSPLFQ